MNYSIVTVNAENLSQYPQTICYINPKQKSFPLKIEWLKQRFAEGLTIKLLYPEGEAKPQGFIEYTRGENAYRAVSAKGFIFIQCIWVYGNTYKNKGIGSSLIEEVVKDAKTQSLCGVAVMTSTDAFMAKSALFLKNGFTSIEKASTGHELLVKQWQSCDIPRFSDWKSSLQKYSGLHIVYSKQCPWVARFVCELDDFIKDKGLVVTITELKTPQEAQSAPSPYATFSLINNGKLLVDHYISMTRFTNILKKEKLI